MSVESRDQNCGNEIEQLRAALNQALEENRIAAQHGLTLLATNQQLKCQYEEVRNKQEQLQRELIIAKKVCFCIKLFLEFRRKKYDATSYEFSRFSGGGRYSF